MPVLRGRARGARAVRRAGVREPVALVSRRPVRGRALHARARRHVLGASASTASRGSSTSGPSGPPRSAPGPTSPTCSCSRTEAPEVGATISHPHGQIFAYDRRPARPPRRARGRTACALCAEEPGDRLVAAAGGWRAWVPWASVYPYGLVVAPGDSPARSADSRRRPTARDLAAVLVDVLARLDRLFGAPMPYMMWFHQRPFDGGAVAARPPAPRDRPAAAGAGDGALRRRRRAGQRLVREPGPAARTAAAALRDVVSRSASSPPGGSTSSGATPTTPAASSCPMAIDLGTTLDGERGGGRGACSRSAEEEGAADRPPRRGGPGGGHARRGRGTSPASSPSSSRRTGFTGHVSTTIPIGTGLSSSAALEVAVALALGRERAAPASWQRPCRRAEHRASGVPCGIMDQLASLAGVEGHALLIDCTTLDGDAGAAARRCRGGRRRLRRAPARWRPPATPTRRAEVAAAEELIGPLPTRHPSRG